MLRILFLSILVLAPLTPDSAMAQPAELMLATRAGDFDKVSALLAMGAQPDPEGIATPLYFAAQAGHLNIVKILLESGADPNAQSAWGTPLHIAARRGHLDVANSLLQYGADSNATGGEYDTTPLHEAAQKGSVNVGQLLIDHGADVNARNIYFEPPIHIAMKRNWPALAELLRESGAAAIKVEPISGELAGANLELGRIKALECSGCHRLGKVGGGVGNGPRLWGVVGQPIANKRQVYTYSDAMLAQSGSWTFERLNAFLADPAGTVPGYSGMLDGFVEDQTARINLIAYLRTLSDDPVPLP